MRRLLLPLVFLMPGLPVFADEFPAIRVYEKTSKSVVLILSRFEGKQSLVGAGSLVGGKGIFLTSAHVVVDKEGGKPASNVEIFVKPEKVTGDVRKDFTLRYRADIAAYDADLDLAVLTVRDFREDVEPIPFAREGEIRIGEEVVAIGHPEQGGFWTLTYGRISGEIENQANVAGRDVYQTDTSVNRGNSGGPLLDRYGRLVGVTANIARIGAGNVPITGVNFAVKSVVAGRWLEKSGYPARYGNPPVEAPVSPVAVGKGASSAVPGPVAPSAAGPAREAQPEPAERQPPRGEEDRGQVPGEDRILTPRRPYRMDDFLAEVEKEMSGVMEEMRGKIRR
jgi:serine protease Do